MSTRAMNKEAMPAVTYLAKPAAAPERYLDTTMTWHLMANESDGILSLGEVSLSPGSEPPMHIHAREDEAWFILEGSILFQRGMERILLGAGQAIFLPRGITHGFAVQTPEARILHAYTPAGLEGAFRSLSVGSDDSAPEWPLPEIEAAFVSRGVRFVGPPLPVLLESEAKLASEAKQNA